MIPEQDSSTSRSEYITKQVQCCYSFITGFYERLTLSIRRAAKNGGSQISVDFDKNMCPVLPHFWSALCERPSTIHTILVYGLQLHAEIFRSFRGQRVPLNCRIMSLRYAKDVQHAFQPVLRLTKACERSAAMPNGRFEFLIDFDEYLRHYATENRWDIYHQSPWTAGSTIARIHVKATLIGISLCHSRGSLGAILHLYHYMIARNILQEGIPVFAHLIRILKEVCFPGGLPKENFYSHLCRFLGGKIDFARKSIAVTYTGRRFVLAVPKELPKMLDKEIRLDPLKLSIFYTLHANNYDIDDHAFQKLMNGERKASRARPSDGIDPKNGPRFSTFLTELKARVSKEFEGDFPIGKVNWFAVYAMCQKVLEVFAHHYNKLFSVDQTSNIEAIGKDYAAVQGILILLNIVQVTEEKHGEESTRRFVLETCPETVRPALLALQSVEDGNDLSKYLWDI